MVYPWDQMGQFGQSLLPQIPNMLANPMTAPMNLFGAGASGIRNVLNQGQGAPAQAAPPAPMPAPMPQFGGTGQSPALNPAGRTDVPYQYGGAVGPAGSPGLPGGEQNIAMQRLLSAISNPREAVIQNMRQMQVNPASMDLRVQNALKNANDVVINMLPSLLASTDPNSLDQNIIGGLQSQIRAALTGGNYLRSAGSGMDALRQILAGAGNVPEGESGTGRALLAAMFGDPEQAAGLIAGLTQGGLSDKVAALAQRNLGFLPSALQAQVATPGTNRVSALDLFLNNAAMAGR